MALRLHAITLADAAQNVPAREGEVAGDGDAPGLALIPFRDLCAVVSPQRSFVLEEATSATIEEEEPDTAAARPVPVRDTAIAG